MKMPLLFCLSWLCIPGCQPKHSPGPTTDKPVEKESTTAIPVPDSFVGLTLEQAEARAEKADLPHRVVKRDGESLPVTRDYRPERLNFTVENGKVISVTNG